MLKSVFHAILIALSNVFRDAYQCPICVLSTNKIEKSPNDTVLKKSKHGPSEELSGSSNLLDQRLVEPEVGAKSLTISCNGQCRRLGEDQRLQQ